LGKYVSARGTDGSSHELVAIYQLLGRMISGPTSRMKGFSLEPKYMRASRRPGRTCTWPAKLTGQNGDRMLPQMAQPRAEADGLNIVLVGSLNPAIFQPYWFARHKLLRDAEVEAAKIELVRPEFTKCTVGPFDIQVVPTQAIFEISDIGNQGPLLDLVTSVLQILSETPIKAFGLNRHMHFREPKERMDEIGHALAPPAIWDGVLGDKPELRALVALGRRKNSDGRIQVSVQPSNKVAPGVHVAVNEHFDLAEANMAALLARLRRQYDPFALNAMVIATRVMTLEKPTS